MYRCGHADPREVQLAVVHIVKEMFPAWMPGMFRSIFVKHFPTFSNMLNAWVMSFSCQWLVGANKVNDVELEDGTILHGQGVFIERYDRIIHA
jgi:hypothetical protein